MTYTVEPARVEGCDCEDCRAGRHLYSLLRWTGNEWQFVGISLQSYTSAEECKRSHRWGMQFAPEDTWEDGTPIVEPAPNWPPGSGRPVILDQAAFAKSAEALERHWLR